jgi:hypothetical protein
MKTWQLMALTAAMTGCVQYGKSTLRPGSNTSAPSKPSVGAVVAATVLCAAGVTPDTSKVGQPPCAKAQAQPDAVQPAPLPAKKP